MNGDLPATSATELVQSISAGTYTARYVTEVMLGRVERFNSTLNALCTPNEAALAEADAIDARRASGAAPR